MIVQTAMNHTFFRRTGKRDGCSERAHQFDGHARNGRIDKVVTQSLTHPPTVREHEHLKSDSLQVARTKRRLKATSIVQDLFGLINQVTSHKIVGVDRVTSKQSPHEFVFPVPGALDYYVTSNHNSVVCRSDVAFAHIRNLAQNCREEAVIMCDEPDIRD